MTVTITHLGCPGHLCVARYCRWHRHTQVDGPGGSWRISSIGNYYLNDKLMTIGAGDDAFFETMVFKTDAAQEVADSNGCGCRPVTDWCEVDSERYAKDGAAQAGHEQFVAKYAKKASKKRARK